MPVPPAWSIAAEAWPRAFRPQRAIRVGAELLGLLIFFTVVTALLFRQWLPHLNAALVGPPEDNMQDFWNTWYVAVGRQPGQFFLTGLLRFPEGTSLYLHSFAYPKVFAIALLTRIVGADTDTLVLLQNISILISFPAAGTGAFYLLRHLTGSTAGALVGGFVFAFSPSHVEHAMHHAGVASIEYIPLFVLCYLRAAERKSPAFLVLATLLYALSALSCWYYLFYLAYFILFHSLCTAVRERRMPGGWRLTAAIACPAAVAAILAPLLVPMARAAIGTAWTPGAGSNAYAADLAGLVAFPRFHALAPLADGLYERFKGNAWESTVYLGLANLTLLAWALLTGRARRGPALTYALWGIAVFYVVAAGNWLQAAGQATIPLPGAAISWLPFFSVMQAPSRAIVLVYLFLAIAVADAARSVWRHGQRFGRGALLAVSALMVLDYAPARPLAMTPVACPAGLEVIRNDPETGFGVLDLPPHGYIERNFYMLQQACHGRPIVLGNVSRRDGLTLGDRLDTWNVAAQRDQLMSSRVKYVVMRSQPGTGPLSTPRPPGQSPRFAWQPQDAPPAHYAAIYRLVHKSHDLTIFRVY